MQQNFYLRYLNIINKQTENIEDSLKKTTHNKALFQLMEIQKSLVYFTTALKDNQLVLQKLLRMVHTENLQRILKFTEDDIDMLEDVIVKTNKLLRWLKCIEQFLKV